MKCTRGYRIIYELLNFALFLFLLTGCGAGGGGGSTSNQNNPTADATPPSIPTNLVATAVSSNQVDLSWSASTDNNAVTGYKIYKSGTYLTSVITASASDTGLNPSTQYCYAISAFDAAGNESPQSSAKCATTPTAASPKGNISGKLLVGPTLSQAPKVLPKALSGEGSGDQQAEFVIGEVIVKFVQTTTIAEGVTKLQEIFSADGLQMTSEISVINAAVLRANIYDSYKDGVLNREEGTQKTLDLIQRILTLSFIAKSEPNYVSSVQAIPNDPQYPEQWNYKTIALPYAWDITTGSSDVIVAVLDSGVRFEHPDLNSNLLTTGYDFIEDPTNGGDNDGIDPDPTDTSDPLSHSHNHGTHVSGIIAAVSNNRIGVAGVAWNAKIMPVRVCGNSNCSDKDIIQGLLYATGLSNDSHTAPSKPAKVINMSLGGPAYNSFVQDVINQVVAQGITVIAAAGNDAENKNPINYPCAYNNVICVGAVGPSLTRASYSEYNSFVDVVAPGGLGGIWGEIFSSNNVLSTVWNDKASQPAYKSWPGTSMATPHVSGVAALILSVNPALTPAQIEQILKETADDLGTFGKDDEYGYGLINAFRAVGYGILLTTPILHTQPAFLYLTPADLNKPISILNIGGGSLIINSVTPIEKFGGNWLSTSVDKSVAPATVTATVNSSGLSSRVYGATIFITTSEGTEKIPVIFDNRITPDLGTVVVRLIDSQGNLITQTTTSKAQGYSYQFINLTPGSYYVEAGTDKDGSGDPDNWGEFIGNFPLLGSASLITVEAGKTASGIDFSLQDVGDLVYFDGNGLGPIIGALLVNVVDETGEPVEGAKVYVGNGNNTGTTNYFGRTTILGNFIGPQTITATAPGYTTHTYYQTNASYLTFSLDRINPLTTTLAVTLTGLSSGEVGCVWVNSDPKCVIYAGINPTLNFTVPQDTPINLSSIAYDSNEIPTKFFHDHYTDGISTPISITSPLGPPLGWRYLQEWVNKPSGNFSKTSPIEWGAYSYAYLGLHQSPVWTGFRSNSYFTFSFLADSWFDIWMAKTDEPDYNALGVCVSNGLSESSCAYAQASFDQLPSVATYNLYDVPYLYMPVSITVSSLTPTFWWSNTFQPSLQGVTISEPVTGYEWEIDVPSGVSMITLPNIPTGGLSGGTAYEWTVMNMIAPSFDYNNFDMKYVMQNLWGLSQSQTGDFVTP